MAQIRAGMGKSGTHWPGLLHLLRHERAFLLCNLVLFAFNLFPLPPLDGGRIMTSLLPNRFAFRYARLEPYGFFIMIGLMMLNLLNYWMIPVIAGANALLNILVSPLKLLLT